MEQAASGVTLAPTKRKYLPNKILRAIDEAAQLKGLTAGVRTTLLTICRYVKQQDPLGAVFTRKEKIAQRAGLSERSIHRHIVKLVELGLLRTEDQRHGQKNGKFLVTHVFLTEKMAKMVGLIGAGEGATEEGTLPAPPSAKMAGGHIKESLTVPSSTKKQGRPTPAHGQRTEPTIPADLQPLAELGMWPQTICKLMREAKDNGKLLSDILVAVRKRLVELKLGGKAIATYLRKAIASNTDFAAQAKRTRDEEHKAAQDRADATYIAAFREQFAGKRLSSPDGRESIVIHASGEHAHHQIGMRTGTLLLTTRIDVGYVLEKINDGRLVEGLSAPSVTMATAPARSSTVLQHLELLRKTVGIRNAASVA